VSEEPLPHSIEAEQQLLGALLNNNDLHTKVVDIVKPESFYDPVHRDIFYAISGRIEQGKIASPVTLKIIMETHPGLKELGGPRYIFNLSGAAISSFAIRDYAEVVVSYKSLRDVITASRMAIGMAYDIDPNVFNIASELEEAAGKIVGSTTTNPLVISNLKALTDAIQSINDAYQRGTPDGVQTGIKAIDREIGSMAPGDLIVAAGRPSQGKAQPLSEPVLKENGEWVEIGDLKIGDKLASIDGKPSTVTGVYPQGRQPVWRVEFSRGRATRCNGAHLWSIESSRFKGQRTLTTLKLREKISTSRYAGRTWVPWFGGKFGKSIDLGIDPWLLGYLIGNGYWGNYVRVSTSDNSVIERIQKTLPKLHKIKHVAKYDYQISSPRGQENKVLSAIRSLGLGECKSHQKFIPSEFKKADRKTRSELMKGLMDSDGWVEPHGAPRYCTTSNILAADVVWLIGSLGGAASSRMRCTSHTYNKEKRSGKDAYTITIKHPNPSDLFWLERKKNKLFCVKRPARSKVIRILPDGVEEQVCISVSHETGLYITRDFIVTHNTTLAQNIGLNVATADDPKGVFIASLEMSTQGLSERALSRLMYDRNIKVPYSTIRQGQLSESQMMGLVRTGQEVAGSIPLHYGERFVRPLPLLRSACRRAKQEYADNLGLGLIIVDYLQQVEHPKLIKEYEVVSEAIKGLKSLAMELAVPVLAVSQLSREVENRSPPIPRLSDLRSTGQIEQEADIVMFTYRDEYYLERSKPQDHDVEGMANWQANMERCRDRMDVIIAKQRMGAATQCQIACEMKYNWVGDLPSEGYKQEEMGDDWK